MKFITRLIVVERKVIAVAVQQRLHALGRGQEAQDCLFALRTLGGQLIALVSMYRNSGGEVLAHQSASGAKSNTGQGQDRCRPCHGSHTRTRQDSVLALSRPIRVFGGKHRRKAVPWAITATSSPGPFIPPAFVPPTGEWPGPRGEGGAPRGRTTLGNDLVPLGG